MQTLKSAAAIYLDLIENHATAVAVLWPGSLVVLAYLMWG